MLQVPDRVLPAAADRQLAVYQAEVDAAGDYAARVSSAKRLFASRNRAANPTFHMIRSTLERMCGGVRRCMYCEDSFADEVEHIRPETLYPEVVFVWLNYLYACGPCNGGKSSNYYIFRPETGETQNVARRRNQPIHPPPAGLPVLLDPRQEDPLEWLRLDLVETFWIRPRPKLAGREHERAERTIELLGLNLRLLPDARRAAYASLIGLLERYRQKKTLQAGEQTLANARVEIMAQPHPTVWAEMKRQRHLVAELDQLFASIPEALGW